MRFVGPLVCGRFAPLHYFVLWTNRTGWGLQLECEFLRFGIGGAVGVAEAGWVLVFLELGPISLTIGVVEKVG